MIPAALTGVASKMVREADRLERATNQLDAQRWRLHRAARIVGGILLAIGGIDLIFLGFGIASLSP